MLLHILFGIGLTVQLQGGNSAFILTPSVTNINACPDQDVVLSCTPNNTVVTSIEWTIEVPGCLVLTPITRTTTSSVLTSSPTSTTNGSCPTGITFHLSTVSVSPFVSRVNVTASTALDGTEINCGNRDGRSEAVRINVVVQPTSPDGVMISEVFNGANVAVSFQWNDLSSMSGVSHDISITPALESEVVIRDNVVQLTVMYNVRYHVNITAISCAGKSEPYLGELYYVNCGTPSTGDNVIVDGLTPPRVAQGTNVTFRCQSGQWYSLIGPTTATCSDDGLWKPSTSDVECVVDCGVPIPASMLIVEPYVNTTRGSLITYHCDDGLIPNNTITATCQNDGQWSRDPSRHVCVLPTAAVCGDPVPPSHGSIAVYTSTVEGTTLTFQCDEGYSPTGEMTTTCTAKGQWEPNPEDTECIVMDNKGDNSCQLSHGAAISLTAVICSTVFFVIGCVVGVLSVHCISKYKKASTTDHESEQHVPVPVYEDVCTTSCDKQTIELNENVAYGQTKVHY